MEVFLMPENLYLFLISVKFSIRKRGMNFLQIFFYSEH